MLNKKNNFPIESFHFSKKKGQNFLIDQEKINEIYTCIENLKNYDAILEIGPGFGAITNFLVKQNKPLFCVELDKKIYSYLQKKFNHFNHFNLINDDILNIDLDTLLKKFKCVIVIANIPYNITSLIIIHCLKSLRIKTMYLMVQYEVADKLCNYHKNHNRNAFVNIVNYYCEIKKIFDLSPSSFFPQPKVNSSYIVMRKKIKKEYDDNFYKFIKTLFIAKRKKLLNNLPNFITKEKMINWLINNKINLNVRAEELDYSILLKMYKELK